ncbi:thiol:disulfide interchange protein TlpA [Alsobacter sp. SYSU BS001988]|jgi:thiol-disulfide isomerase/thioredoxin
MTDRTDRTPGAERPQTAAASATAPRRRALVVAGVGVAAALGLGLAVLYGTNPGWGNAGDADCAPALAVAQAMQPLARGEVAAVQVSKAPKPLPALAFNGPDGKPMSLADLKGRTVLLNLWATWCAPCRQEMPALDAAQEKLGGDDFQVVTVNIDTRNLDKPRQWLADNKVTRLAYHSDPSAKIFQDLKAIGKAFGMPTTLIVDPKGCELASIAGPAEWSSEDALTLLKAAARK